MKIGQCLKYSCTVLLASLAAGGWTPPLAQAESLAGASGLAVYERKSITILQQAGGEFDALYKQAFLRLGRFTYHPIAMSERSLKISHADAVRDFVAAVRAQKERQAGKIAAQGAESDPKFQGIVLTGEQLDRVVRSSYVLAPGWHYGIPYLSEPSSHVDSRGNETISLTARVPLTLYNEIYEVESGKRLADQAITQEVSITLGMEIPAKANERERDWRLQDLERQKQQALEGMPEHTFRHAAPATANSLLESLITTVRRLDPFILKSYITADPAGDSLRMRFGQDNGVQYDSGWRVFKKIKQEDRFELEPVGFIKVREIGELDSLAQTIIEGKTFSLGDQLIEIPQNGYDIGLRFGMSPFLMAARNSSLLYHDGVDEYPIGTAQAASTLAPAVALTAEADLAPFFAQKLLSETYATLELAGMLSSPFFGFELLAGLK
ncbi:MAG: hypothetical protein HY692_05375, partial [Cyanobacteria bacterium NC_groundwater_1444_Ag_S-0.65um_54_12]|nr:hypothetical protein [Cyanobacteria bacterium NC_groundwater_1444_Ag_S-0.65um_54_12]